MESIICGLSVYIVKEKKIKQDICSLSQYEIDELCSNVIEEIDVLGRLRLTPKKENEHMSHFVYISYSVT